jgi:hypothetical protein
VSRLATRHFQKFNHLSGGIEKICSLLSGRNKILKKFWRFPFGKEKLIAPLIATT